MVTGLGILLANVVVADALRPSALVLLVWLVVLNLLLLLVLWGLGKLLDRRRTI